MNKISLFLMASVLLVSAQLASATPMVYSQTYSDSVAVATTNWNSSMTIPKFNMPGYELTGVEISLMGDVSGSAKFESLDSSSATITMNLQSSISLNRPNGTILVVTIPIVSSVDPVASFDGVIDFGGASGRTYTNLSATKTETAMFTATDDLNLFTGSGNIVLPVVATGTSSGSGAGNLITQFSTQAGASASVTYHYMPIVPEPVTMSLLCLGGLGCLIRRR